MHEIQFLRRAHGLSLGDWQSVKREYQASTHGFRLFLILCSVSGTTDTRDRHQVCGYM